MKEYYVISSVHQPRDTKPSESAFICAPCAMQPCLEDCQLNIAYKKTYGGHLQLHEEIANPYKPDTSRSSSPYSRQTKEAL